MYKIWGYVTTFRRNSKRIWRPGDTNGFYEQVEYGAFHRSIWSGKKIPLVLNHDETKVLSNTSDGTLLLYEDFIGLKFEATIQDVAIVRDIQMRNIEGCSFQFKSIKEHTGGYCKGLPIRILDDVMLGHVSLIKKPKEPAYEGTIVYYIGNDNGKES